MLGLGTAGSVVQAATTIASWPLLVLLLCLLGQWPVAEADIRCHCNLAPCVSTGYMCKSELGLCFSENVKMTSSVLNVAATTAPRHGCVDLVADVADDAANYGCKEPDGAPSTISETRLSPEGRQCCSDDMCNFQRDFQEPGASESRTRGGVEQHSCLTDAPGVVPGGGNRGAHRGRLGARAARAARPPVCCARTASFRPRPPPTSTRRCTRAGTEVCCTHVYCADAAAA
nr:BMP and activin membrane-bound inhibitor homolog [Rhipicephalus microplus]